MIEFAPNPSGPAHLGTLRTYAVAWIEAKRLNMPLFVRFDDHNKIYSTKWVTQFLDELEILDMLPNGWQYFTEKISTTILPEWAITMKCPGGYKSGKVLAYYPDYIINKRLPSNDSNDYILGNKFPMKWYKPNGDLWDYAWNSFAELKDDKYWIFHPWTVNAIHMNLRGVKFIVRSFNLAHMYICAEKLTQKWFRLKLPKCITTSMVVDDRHGLSKHLLKPNDVGTIQWALKKYGAEILKEKILSSVIDKNAPPIISIYDLLGK